MVEGAALFIGSIAFIVYTAHDLILVSPSILATFLCVVLLNVAEATLIGFWLRSVNLAVRQVGRVEAREWGHSQVGEGRRGGVWAWRRGGEIQSQVGEESWVGIWAYSGGGA